MSGQDKAAYVHRMFSTIAARYDLLNTLLSFGSDRGWRRFAVAQCALAPGDLALDVCTGTAEIARRMARQHPRNQVVALDFNRDMLRQAKAKLARKPEGRRVHLVMGDGLRLPFPDNTFASSAIGFALRNVADVAGTFREMARVVKPGGRVVSLELTRPSSSPVRAVYYIYLLRIAPFIGGIISGKQAAYTYLPDSILKFPPPERIAEIMEAAGLRPVRTYRLMLGAATVQVGTKQPA